MTVRFRVLIPLALLFAGCAIAPEGTSLDRIHRSLYHVDHPEWGRPVTIAEQRPDFTGTHPAPSRQAEATWKADVDRCASDLDQKPCDPKQSVGAFYHEYRRGLWECMWAKDWRWEQ